MSQDPRHSQEFHKFCDTAPELARTTANLRLLRNYALQKYGFPTDCIIEADLLAAVFFIVRAQGQLEFVKPDPPKQLGDRKNQLMNVGIRPVDRTYTERQQDAADAQAKIDQRKRDAQAQIDQLKREKAKWEAENVTIYYPNGRVNHAETGLKRKEAKDRHRNN